MPAGTVGCVACVPPLRVVVVESPGTVATVVSGGPATPGSPNGLVMSMNQLSTAPHTMMMTVKGRLDPLNGPPVLGLGVACCTGGRPRGSLLDDIGPHDAMLLAERGHVSTTASVEWRRSRATASAVAATAADTRKVSESTVAEIWR